MQQGAAIYARTCAQCHGQLAVGGVKDLRQMTRETHAQFNDIVLKGLRVQKGMASFANLLTVEEVEAVHAYVISRALEDWGQSLPAATPAVRTEEPRQAQDAAGLLHGEERSGVPATPTSGRRFQSTTESRCTRFTTHRK